MPNVGSVVQVTGPVVDCRFTTDTLPEINNAIKIKDAKRNIDLGCLDRGEVKQSPTGKAVQQITVRQGVDTELARKIVKMIKVSKIKVQAAIQGPQVRISGKKRDDLQQVIAMLKEAELGLPLQYTNFRD